MAACSDVRLQDGQASGQTYLMGQKRSVPGLFVALFQLSKWVVQWNALQAGLVDFPCSTLLKPPQDRMSPGAGCLSPLSRAPWWCSELWKICHREGKMQKEVGVLLMSRGIEISPVQLISFRVEEKKATVESP